MEYYLDINEEMRIIVDKLKKIKEYQSEMHDQLGDNETLEELKYEMYDALSGWIASNC